MPKKTCSTCQCNKVCDHNKYGFENCGNYIPADVVPKSEVARTFRQRMNEKMGKHTHLLGKEYVQRIMREIEKEFTEEKGWTETNI